MHKGLDVLQKASGAQLCSTTEKRGWYGGRHPSRHHAECSSFLSSLGTQGTLALRSHRWLMAEEWAHLLSFQSCGQGLNPEGSPDEVLIAVTLRSPPDSLSSTLEPRAAA